MEEYISQQYDQAALMHLRNQIINEISKKNCENKLKNNAACTYGVISALRSQIEALESGSGKKNLFFKRRNYREKRLD